MNSTLLGNASLSHLLDSSVDAAIMRRCLA